MYVAAIYYKKDAVLIAYTSPLHNMARHPADAVL
jgi:hypothetical protein